MKIKGLILAGGHSSRMQKDKAALVFNGQKLRDLAFMSVAPWVETAYLSLRPEQKIPGINQDRVIYDELQDIGPAAALLAAHRRFPDSTWLVLACDFPLVTSEAVGALWQAYFFRNRDSDSSITCFVHANGKPEPLFSVWEPSALKKLNANVIDGFQGPLYTLNQCAPNLITPQKNSWLMNTNTPAEWAQALMIQALP